MKNKLKSFAQRQSSLLLFAIIFIVASIFAKNFFSVRNVLNIVRQNCVLGLITIGVSCVLITGHMDLSVSGIVSLTGLIALSFQKYMPVGLAIVSALLIGLLCGFANGLIIKLVHANSGESLMITFGTQLIFAAISLLYTGGFSLQGSKSDFYNALGMKVYAKYLPLPFLILLAFVILMAVIEHNTLLGRRMHMAGFNPVCSRMSGVNPGNVSMIAYSISGLMSAAAAIILTSRTLGTTPTAGNGYEMDAIVAAVLGGVSLSGGVGSIPKAFVGVLTLGMISNAMNLLGFGAHDQSIVKGCILVLAIAIDVINRRKQV